MSGRRGRFTTDAGALIGARRFPHLRTLRPRLAALAETVDYYNHENRHSGTGLHTAASVHYGTVMTIRAQRAKTLDAAYAANPHRFCGRRPTPPKLATVAWINNPTIDTDLQTKS